MRSILPYLKICLGGEDSLRACSCPALPVQLVPCLSINCLTSHQACEFHLFAMSKAVSSKTTALYPCLRFGNPPISAGPSIASSTSNRVTKLYMPSRFSYISSNFSNLIYHYFWTLTTLSQRNLNTTTSHGRFFLQGRNDRLDPQSRIAYHNI